MSLDERVLYSDINMPTGCFSVHLYLFVFGSAKKYSQASHIFSRGNRL